MSHDRLSVAIVEKIASREGVPVTDLRPPLYSAVDPVALEKLVCSLNPSGEVQFVYDGYAVAVDGEGTIRIEDDGKRGGFTFDDE